MSEPKPVWLTEGPDADVIKPTENSNGFVKLSGPIWRVTVGDSLVTVAELIRSLHPHAIQDMWPQLRQDDIAAALEFAASAIEAQVARMGQEKEAEDDCYVTPTPAPAHIRFMAFCAGGLMFALALLVLWFLLQQLWR